MRSLRYCNGENYRHEVCAVTMTIARSNMGLMKAVNIPWIRLWWYQKFVVQAVMLLCSIVFVYLVDHYSRDWQGLDFNVQVAVSEQTHLLASCQHTRAVSQHCSRRLCRWNQKGIRSRNYVLRDIPKFRTYTGLRCRLNIVCSHNTDLEVHHETACFYYNYRFLSGEKQANINGRVIPTTSLFLKCDKSDFARFIIWHVSVLLILHATKILLPPDIDLSLPKRSLSSLQHQLRMRISWTCQYTIYRLVPYWIANFQIETKVS